MINLINIYLKYQYYYFGFEKELIDEYEDTLLNPYVAADRGIIDSVIDPQDTRMHITKALRSLKNKRVALPPRKHGNIPL